MSPPLHQTVVPQDIHAPFSDPRRRPNRRRQLAGVVALSWLLGACSGIDRRLDEADESLQAAEYERAIAVLERVQPATDADHYRRHRSMAIALAGVGDHAGGVRHTTAAFDLDRRQAAIDVIEMAAPYFRHGRIEKARAYYEALRARFPYAYGSPGHDTWRVTLSLEQLARRLGKRHLEKQARGQTALLRMKPVVLVVVDTLRADHLGLYGHTRDTSPHLDKWARRGRVFERAYSTSSWTLPSFGSLYTGYWPMRHRAGVASQRQEAGGTPANVLSNSVRTLAEALLARGYRTGAVINNPYLDSRFGMERGFEVYDHAPGDLNLRANGIVDRSLALIDRWGSQPFFLVVHMFDPHMPYDPPAAVRGRFTDGLTSKFSVPISDIRTLRKEAANITDADRHFVQAAYDEEVAFVDQQLHRFREELDARDLLDDSLIALVGDHGEELFDHAGFEHGHAMWEEVVRIPFVVWGPEITPGRSTVPVSIADIAPTVLDWIDAPVAPDLHGRSLLPYLEQEVPIPQRTLLVEGRLYGPHQHALVRWPWKVVVDADARPKRVVNLSRDPEERLDLADANPTVVGTMLQELGTLIADESALMGEDRPVELDEASLERLRALGYLP